MRKLAYVALLGFLLAGASGFLTGCKEKEEASVYDNWQERNDDFVDSLNTVVTSANFFYTASVELEDVDAVPVNTLFAIETSSSTTEGTQFVYCKKLSKYIGMPQPIYTDQVSVHYYGTYIIGVKFDGTFKGYAATEHGTLDPNDRLPTATDSPSTMKVSSLVSGFTTALQFMHVGERWMLYIPYDSGYGSSSSSVVSYSTLVFDVILEAIK